MNAKNENQATDRVLTSWEELYIGIKAVAIAKEWKNTAIALEVACQYHDGQKRKGGEPYIIHPLMVCKHLINLQVDNDIRCAAALLHDVIEDCDEQGNISEETFTKRHGLNKRVYEIVSLLSKPKDYKKFDPNEDKYYSNIKQDKDATIIKLADRANNLSTLSSFTKEKMIKYVNETKRHIYTLCTYAKTFYPEFSNAVTIIKYQIRSICETIEALYDINELQPDFLRYRKTYVFIRYYAKAKKRINLQKALSVANILHEGDVRSNGEPFILHPLRVCSYLISLKINDDISCSAALLHEVLKRKKISEDGTELVDTYNLDPQILEIVKLLTKTNNITNEEYYERLKGNVIASLVKLSNRAHTCTRLSTYSDKQKKEYIKETDIYITDLCNFVQDHYPEYWDAVEIMKYHIFSICKIVEVITNSKKNILEN